MTSKSDNTSVEFVDDGIEVDAAIVGEGLAIDTAHVLSLMREGKITSQCECGIGNDAGRYRLSFFSANRRLRLIVDHAGNILKRSVVDFGDHPLPRAMRRLR